MILIENTVVDGWSAAVRGARNPLNSWARSDSTFGADGSVVLGENDLGLLKRLAKAGTDHSKYLRYINVSCDITAPAYWVAEHDTYKVATVRNSCSFMHKGVSKPFSLDDFSVIGCGEDDTWPCVLDALNRLREEYLETGDANLFIAIRQLLPQGYNIRYTWQANYQVLMNIYHARKHHRLPEWHDFCHWCEGLPYFRELCCDE